MRALLLLLTLAALAAGCSNRERSNPLDPGNPTTGGRPEGFNAVAGYAIVRLSWTPQPGLAIDGFEVQRLAPGDSVYRPLGSMRGPAVSSLNDLGVTNGATYRYRLYYVIRGALGHLPAEDLATPGALRPWVADAGAARLLELSPDGRDIVASTGDAQDLQSLALDPSDGRVWTSARFDGLVTTRVPGGLSTTTISGLSQPYTMAVNPSDHGAWVCELGGSLLHVAPDGTRLAPGTIDLLDTPTGVAVSPRDHSVWVCEYGGDRVRHFSATGSPLGMTPLGAPSRVVVDSASGQAYVSSVDLGRLWRLAATSGGVLDSTTAALGPLGLVLDARRSRLWVADAAGSRVLALDPLTLAVQFTVPGISEPRDIDLDAATGEAWVVARGSREIVRVSPAGQVVQRLGGFADPTEVRVDPGQ